MANIRICRRFFFLTFLLVFILVSGALILRDNISCLGVPVVPQSVYEKHRHYSYQNLNGTIFFNGEPAAIDVESSTIYLPQELSETTRYNELPGKLEISLFGYRLYFNDGPAFDSLYSYVHHGNALELIVITGPDTYMRYNVILTVLPVININGEAISEDEEGRTIYSGTFQMWDSHDPELDAYSTVSSAVQWHVRGQTTSVLSKKPWKLSLKGSNGGNKSLSLMGLGEDDDWILNPMNADDSRIREKFSMDLWNEISSNSNHNLKMSSAEYVELVINGQYFGLYLLQRRIDQKYLDLEDNDILFKGIRLGEIYGPENMYEIIYSPLDESSSFSLMDGYWDYTDCSMSNTENFVDANLFLLLLSSMDNYTSKNMYYCLLWEDGEYSLYLIPWDTDLSLGLAYLDSGFRYNYDYCIDFFKYRPEYNSIKSRQPDIDSLIAQRWAQLREEQFSEEHLVSLAQNLNRQLELSGALARDRLRWPLRYGGTDTVDALCEFICERLAFLDQKFGYRT